MVGENSGQGRRVRHTLMAHRLPQCCLPSTTMGALPVLRGADIAAASRPGPVASPIDTAYGALRAVTSLSASVSSDDWNANHGLILTAAAVAAVEDYVRSILALLPTICPFARERAETLTAPLRFLGLDNLSDAVRHSIGDASFSNISTIRDWSKRIAGSDLKASPSLKSALAEYERICHLRHCAVHAGGYVAQHNARELGLEPGSWIALRSPAVVYEVVSIATSAMRSLNQELFRQTVTIWIDKEWLVGDWAADRESFSVLWRAFASKVDAESGPDVPIPRNGYQAYRQIRPAVLARAQGGLAG